MMFIGTVTVIMLIIMMVEHDHDRRHPIACRGPVATLGFSPAKSLKDKGTTS
jgi:hypothetical protein